MVDQAKPTEAMTQMIDAIDQGLRRSIDNAYVLTGYPRETMAVEVGRELILLGCSYMANGIGIADPAVGLEPGLNCVAAFKSIAEGAIRDLHAGIVSLPLLQRYLEHAVSLEQLLKEPTPTFIAVGDKTSIVKVCVAAYPPRTIQGAGFVGSMKVPIDFTLEEVPADYTFPGVVAYLASVDGWYRNERGEVLCELSVPVDGDEAGSAERHAAARASIAAGEFVSDEEFLAMAGPAQGERETPVEDSATGQERATSPDSGTPYAGDEP